MMQAFRTENNYRNASRLSAAELRAAMASREILQSTALAFDTQRQLRFELGGCRAIMPFGQCADGADTGSVRDIAVLTRVGRPTCFVIEGIDTDENGQPVEDVFDYRYLMNEELVVLLVEKPDGEEWELEVEKEYEEDLGIEFENGGLMEDYRSCSNKCMFCFIDQMPPGMRETLYFKDDDSRLSFLQGNYVTLTNMSEKDIERVIRYHLEPINISFQAMNPELRCKMLHNRFAGKALDKIGRASCRERV